MAFDTFFIDPYSDIMPCNGTKNKEVMGNLVKNSWEEIWNSEQAENVRLKVRHCDRNCWMIGSVSPAMHKQIWIPIVWIIKHKILSIMKKKKYCISENRIVLDLINGKTTEIDLDKKSTCELNRS